MKLNDYRVDPETGCWIWQKQRLKNGYGRVERGGKQYVAHRWYYEQFNGPVPDGLEIDHLCNVRACVNPAHLEAVTRTENRRRRRDTKLTIEDVREIRRLRLGCAEIARRYGVSEQMGSRVARGLAWREEVRRAS